MAGRRSPTQLDLPGSDGWDDSSDSDTLSESYSSDEDNLSWVQWYCRQRGNEFLCEVEESYIHDDFNLTGLSSKVPYYEPALDALLELDSDEGYSEQQQELVDAASELLYGLIHARYILTARGLSAMKVKFLNAEFGRCPRVMCSGQPVLPVGRVDEACQVGVNVFCPQCGDIYTPKSPRAAALDGAYFGRTFPHLFFMVYPHTVRRAETKLYIPRVFGFRIAKLVSKPEEPQDEATARETATTTTVAATAAAVAAPAPPALPAP